MEKIGVALEWFPNVDQAVRARKLMGDK